jgi:mono/diheme cytochrome c family protein
MFGMKTRTGQFVLFGTIAMAALGTAAIGQRGRGAAYKYETGKEVYEHICQGCHMPDAKGAKGAGAYPALAGNKALAEATYPALIIMTGQKAMPSFSDLNDAQVTEVVNYIRANFGNKFKGKLTVEEVKTLRAAAVHQEAVEPG